jgi:hypothetical protein
MEVLPVKGCFLYIPSFEHLKTFGQILLCSSNPKIKKKILTKTTTKENETSQRPTYSGTTLRGHLCQDTSPLYWGHQSSVPNCSFLFNLTFGNQGTSQLRSAFVSPKGVLYREVVLYIITLMAVIYFVARFLTCWSPVARKSRLLLQLNNGYAVNKKRAFVWLLSPEALGNFVTQFQSITNLHLCWKMGS